MELSELIKNRQSILHFTDKKVDREILTRVLEAGRLAPSAKNRQPWRFIVIDSPSIKKRIEVAAFGQEHVGQAPVIIASCSTNIDYRMPNGQMSYPMDIAFSTAFMQLQAEAEGLGSCIVTTYDEQEVKDILTVPYSMRVVLLLLLGYAGEKPFPASRKPFSSIVSFNHW